jgi:hypothetical protein
MKLCRLLATPGFYLVDFCSIVLDDPARLLPPVLMDRNKFTLLRVIEHLNDCRLVGHGDCLQFLFQITNEAKVTGR